MAFVGTSPVNAKRIPPLIEGKYTVEVAKSELGKSPKGNTTLKLEMTILDGPEQPIIDQDTEEPTGDTQSCAGRKLTTTVWVDDTSSSLKNALDAFGVSYTEKGWDSEEFTGKEAMAFVKVKIYDEEPVNNVKKFSKLEA